MLQGDLDLYMQLKREIKGNIILRSLQEQLMKNGNSSGVHLSKDFTLLERKNSEISRDLHVNACLLCDVVGESKIFKDIECGYERLLARCLIYFLISNQRLQKQKQSKRKLQNRIVKMKQNVEKWVSVMEQTPIKFKSSHTNSSISGISTHSSDNTHNSSP